MMMLCSVGREDAVYHRYVPHTMYLLDGTKKARRAPAPACWLSHMYVARPSSLSVGMRRRTAGEGKNQQAFLAVHLYTLCYDEPPPSTSS